MRVTLIAVQSLDGYITKHGEPGSDFASGADQAHFRKALASFDCCVMGAETYRTARDQIRGRMTAPRLRIVLTRSPAAFASDAIADQLEFSSESPKSLIAHLQARGCSRCALLGGSQIHSLFLEAGLVDELWLTIEPVLFGEGTPLLAKSTETRLRFLSHTSLTSDTGLLKYEVLR
jgi:dihydrofolate reductase